MLTRLFDSIRLQSLIAALFIMVLLSGSIVLVVEHHYTTLYLPGLEVAISPFLFKIFLVLVMPACALWFNALLNRIGAFELDYHPSVLWAAQVPVIAFLSSRPSLLIAMPLIMLAFQRILTLADKKSSLNVLFDIGNIAALASIIYPQAIMLVLFSWLAALVFGQIELRSFIASILGLFAIYFMLFSIFYFLTDVDFIEFMGSRFGELIISFEKVELLLLGVYVPIVIAVLLAIPDFLAVLNKAKVLKRQSMLFFAMTLVLSLLIGVAINTKAEIFVLAAPPIIVLEANLLRSLKRWWLKDLFYLLVLSSFIIAIFNY